MRSLLLLTLLTLTACTPVYVVGSEVATKQEVAQALAERDVYLQRLALAVEALAPKKEEEKKK